MNFIINKKLHAGALSSVFILSQRSSIGTININYNVMIELKHKLIMYNQIGTWIEYSAKFCQAFRICKFIGVRNYR